METPGHAYIDTPMRTHALDLRTQALCMRTHTWACVHMLENSERQVFCIKIKV